MSSQASQSNSLLSPSHDDRDSSSTPQVRCENHPPVSIILCTLGVRASLDRCLESLLAQNCARSEIILVLNAPMDSAFATALARYPLTFLNEPRRGVCVARNRAIPTARGEILAFVDDDVVAHSNWLHELLQGFEDPQVACVTGRVVPTGPIAFTRDRTERFYYGERALSSWSLLPSDPDCYSKALGDPAGFGCNMAFRKDFLDTWVKFPEDLGAGSLVGGADEFYMFLQVLRHGFRLQHTPSAVVTHHFEKDLTDQKVRTRQLYAGSSAFATKLWVEEKGIRMALLKWGWAAAKRRLSRFKARKRLSSEPQELLTSKEKIVAYLRGPLIYWKSRRAK